MSKVKWRVSPLNIVALAILGQLIFEMIELNSTKGDPGLGGLGVFVFAGALGIVFLIDIIIRMIVSKYSLLITLELILIFVALGVYFFKVFLPQEKAFRSVFNNHSIIQLGIS